VFIPKSLKGLGAGPSESCLCGCWWKSLGSNLEKSH
jgi:hypothetical protein